MMQPDFVILFSNSKTYSNCNLPKKGFEKRGSGNIGYDFVRKNAIRNFFLMCKQMFINKFQHLILKNKKKYLEVSYYRSLKNN